MMEYEVPGLFILSSSALITKYDSSNAESFVALTMC